MRDPAWVGHSAPDAFAARLLSPNTLSITLPMPQVAHIAELSAADYPRFRDRDPKLPATYAAWSEAADRRVSVARRAGTRVLRHPIAYDDFEAFLTSIGLTDFGPAARDFYAADMAAAVKVSGRRRRPLPAL